MPRLTDVSLVRSILERDRAWSAYALGDLSPELAPFCEWHASADGAALALVYRGFSPPILFGMGTPERLASVIQDLDEPELSLHLRLEAVPSLGPRFAPVDAKPMWRMVLDLAAFRPTGEAGVEPLGPAHADEIVRLYGDGIDRDEVPTFFYPSMLEQGTFRGIRDEGDLVAVAGTHLCSADFGVAAIGHVYTRFDRRGHGLATRVTGAVVSAIRARDVGTIVLNVRQTNDGARRVYERLGFGCHCPFVEGLARTTVPRVVMP